MQHSSITVGLPVYNAMPFLPEAIESLLCQTLRNFEILVIVDGASDDSLSYLKTVRDPRLRIVVQPNQGLIATLNRMLAEATTPWLVRQDADDVSYPTRLEHLQEAIEAHPNAGMFYSLAEYYPSQRSVGLFRCSRGSPHELRQMVKSGYLLSICHPSVALNISKTLSIGGYRSLLHAEDADLWWRMALEHDIHLVPEVLVGFRQNTASISTCNSYAQELHGLYIQYLLLSHLSNRTPQPLSVVAPLLASKISAASLEAKQQLRNVNIHFAEKRYRQAWKCLLHAAQASPGYLFQRWKDEYFPSGHIVNGLPPEHFYRRKESFWP